MKILTVSLYIGLFLCEKNFKGIAFEKVAMKQGDEFYQPALYIDETTS